VDGYWLFGFVVADLTEIEVDLMAPRDGPAAGSSLDGLIAAARRRFAEQLAKAQLSTSQVASAGLRVVRVPGEVPVAGTAGGLRHGVGVSLDAFAVTSAGARVNRKTTINVAPHDSALERRRDAKNWGLG
jgi:uncharacterized protein YqfA (UPF0365 family)